VALGGRAAETLIFDQLSTGAHNDLSHVTSIARAMVTQYGMSEALGHLTYGKKHEQLFLGRDIVEEKNYSEETARVIDKEVKKIVDHCYNKARALLVRHKAKLEVLSKTLLEKEVLDDSEVKALLEIRDDHVKVDASVADDIAETGNA
jgi:cell division protease FtsH